jgi:predicted RNA-binding Zn-ribbon protein involved in translation (DUF1610 family)
MTRLGELLARLKLPPAFQVDALTNLVPTHHDCNRRKGDVLLEDRAILYFLEMWAQKQDRVRHELEKHVKAANHDRHLIAISRFIETGELSKNEVLQFFSTVRSAKKPTPVDPLVISFGTNVVELLAAKSLPAAASSQYVKACDWLENDLLFQISGALPVLAHQTEASERNGETLSVRIAFWNLDLDRLDNLEIPHWSILEIAQFSEIYETDAGDLLSKAVVKAHATVVADPWDTAFGVGRCPRCGSQKLTRASEIDHQHDDIYHTIKCDECGWFEWTQ